MLRAYNYCYYGGKDAGFYQNALEVIYGSGYGGSDLNSYDMYLPIETFSKKSGELYDVYEVNIPISAELCKRKTIRQVLVGLQRTTYMRDYQSDPSQSILNEAVKIAKAIHLLAGKKGVAGINYRTRQGLGFSVDLPIVGWRKRYAITEKPYALDKNVSDVLSDDTIQDTDCPYEGTYSYDSVTPILGWYKRDFVVSDFSKEMYSFIQDNDYWRFIIRVNKRNLQQELSTLIAEYEIDTTSDAYTILTPLTQDIFDSIVYSDQNGKTVIVSLASVVVNILVEE